MPLAQKLRATFFRSLAGNEPVREWLKELPKGDRRLIGEDIAYVQFKWPIGKPRVDHLRGPIWEIRTSLENRIARTLFAVEGGEMILLHGFIKKTQKAPEAEIEWASAGTRSGLTRGPEMAKSTDKKAVRAAGKRELGNPHSGSSFDDFLIEEGIFEEVQAKALKRALAEQLEESMVSANLSKIMMAERMATSRSQLDRVLDPDNVSVQLDTLIKAARAVGKVVDIRISDATPARAARQTVAGYAVAKKRAATKKSALR